MLFKNAEFEISCPKCSHKFKVRFDKVGTSVFCPYCNAKIELKDNGFKSGIKDAENQITHLLDGLK